MSVFCEIGIHKRHTSTKFFPSIDAPVVTDVITTSSCARCNKELFRIHLKWNEEIGEMVEITEEKEVA